MRRTASALALLLFAAPAGAQQYWLPNGPGGTTYNNPQGSLSGTYYEHTLRRHADQLRWQRQREQAAGAAGNGAAGASGGTIIGAAPSAARGLDPSFRLNNASGRTIREVYVSASTDNAWGGDRLGQHVLPHGQQLIVRLPHGQCVNDVRVVYMDGQAQEQRQVDTCSLIDLTVQ